MSKTYVTVFLAAAMLAVPMVVSAQLVGLGADVSIDRDAVRVNADDSATTDSSYIVDAAAMLLVNAITELDPVLGVIYTIQRDADLPEPVIDAQLGVHVATGIYRRAISGDHVSFSVGPVADLVWTLQSLSGTADTYVNIQAAALLRLLMDFSILPSWILRFSIDPVRLTYGYLRLNDVRQNSLSVDSELVTGVVRIGIRYLLAH